MLMWVPGLDTIIVRFVPAFDPQAHLTRGFAQRMAIEREKTHQLATRTGIRITPHGLEKACIHA